MPSPENKYLCSRIYISPIPKNVDKRQIKWELEQFGKVENINLKSGYAFVDMSSTKEAERAIKCLHWKIVFDAY